MKKTPYITLLSIMLLATTSCNKQIEKINHQSSIYIVSDTHFLSDSLISESNEIYTKANLTSDGRVQEFDTKLLDAFVREVNENKPDYVFITGDLTLNGERKSHEDYISYLDKITESKVLVIPGNHDINNLMSKSFLDESSQYVENINEDVFKELYASYGYNDALYYDDTSLSYIFELDDNRWVLMLDSNNSEYNYEFGTNFISGFIEESTMNWIKEKLSYAKANNIEVISTMHHNLLVHNELFASNYTLYNYQELLSVYKENNVKINFSGHLHIQSIRNQDGIYDIASGSLLDYGNRYGILDIYENCYEYQSKKINLSTDDFDFGEYSFNVFYQEYYDKTINADIKVYGEEASKITDFKSKINTYYFDGDYIAIHKLIKNNKGLVSKIKRQENKYINSILEVENIDQNYLIVEKVSAS